MLLLVRSAGDMIPPHYVAYSRSKGHFAAYGYAIASLAVSPVTAAKGAAVALNFLGVHPTISGHD